MDKTYFDLGTEASPLCKKGRHDRCAAYDNMVLNIAVAYGGRQEITDAVSAFLTDNLADMNMWEVIARLHRKLSGAISIPRAFRTPDLIIRTRGKFGFRGPCSGRACKALILLMSTGEPFAGSIFCARFEDIRYGDAGSVFDSGTQ